MNSSENQQGVGDPSDRIAQISDITKEQNANKNYQHGPCLICGKRDASKTNSHLVPSFLVSMYDSYDNSGERGKDLLFSISNRERSVYVGALPDTKYEEIFDDDSLKNEDFINELKNDPNAADYVFCPSCEELLAKHLEAPYADSIKKNKPINAPTAYFFWISIIWRMAACGQDFGFRLDESISESLHDLLTRYFDNNAVINNLVKPQSQIFNYKLLYCPGYCEKTQRGFHFCYYNGGVLTVFIADFILIGYFNGVKDLPNDYVFECLRDSINLAKVNDGSKDKEQKLEIDSDVMDAAKNTIVSYILKEKRAYFVEKICNLWSLFHIPLLLTDEIINEIIGEVFSEKLKLAERDTDHSLALAIGSVLNKYGFNVQ